VCERQDGERYSEVGENGFGDGERKGLRPREKVTVPPSPHTTLPSCAVGSVLFPPLTPCGARPLVGAVCFS
jgi:hypothetical protein